MAAVKLAFVSCKEALAGPFLDRMAALYPDLPLYTVSEFPPTHGKWIPYKPNRTLAENRNRIRATLGGHAIRLSAVVLERRTPYPEMQWLAFFLAPAQFIAFNESMDNFMLRPRCAGTIARHFQWRLTSWLRWQTNPGGWLYTWLWRFRHPHALKRPLFYWASRIGGSLASLVRRIAPVQPDPPPQPRPAGVSIVIPSRNGKDLVERLLTSLLPQMPSPGEVIVVDNGSDDGTAASLTATGVTVIESKDPLSFAAAVNRGIRAARYAHVCLLNNDMILEPGFFGPLLDAFSRNPDLFCATAQILFPEGMRRQETGKAVWYSKEEGRELRDFPLRCIEPLAGEDGTWVLYGSGGCSLYDAAKLEQLGGFEERLAPAYVEDLDLGWRGWQRNWPTVFVANARVTHFHRSTTTRYYKPELLQSFVEYNYLRFLARHVVTPAVFGQLWRDAIDRLNLLATEQPWFIKWPEAALGFAPKALRLLQAPPAGCLDEARILAIGSGAIAVFPGHADRGKPRVLIVSPYVPFPLSHGGAVRMYNLMRCGAADFDQILVAFADDLTAVADELKAIAVEIILVKRYPTHLLPDQGRPDVVEEYESPHMDAALDQVMRKWRPRVAQLEFTQTAIYAPRCRPARSILVEHDITFDLQEQMLRNGEDWETRRQYERWLRFEKQAWHDIDAVAVMSDKDRLTVEAEAKGKGVTLANGVDLARFQPSGAEPDPGRILFIGSFAHLPNVLALEFFLREVWPALTGSGVKLHIIAGSRHRYFLDRHAGQVRINLDDPAIEVEDFVADVRPAYNRAAVVIAPLVASAGTNIKIMEAMAMKKAIVSTPAGINGLDLEDGNDLLIARTAAEFSAAVRRLIDDPAYRKAIEEQARRTVQERYDWSAIGRLQAQLYERLLSSPSR